MQRGLRVSRDFRVLGQLAGGVRAEVVSSLIPSEARKDDKNRKLQLFNMCLRGLCHQWIFFFFDHEGSLYRTRPTGDRCLNRGERIPAQELAVLIEGAFN